MNPSRSQTLALTVAVLLVLGGSFALGYGRGRAQARTAQQRHALQQAAQTALSRKETDNPTGPVATPELSLQEFEDLTAPLWDASPALAGHYYQRWAMREPAAAVAAALGAPANLRVAALSGALAGWARHDPVAAWRWLAEKGGDVSWLDAGARRELAAAVANAEHWPVGEIDVERADNWTNASMLTLESNVPWQRSAKQRAPAPTQLSPRALGKLAALIRGSAGSTSVLAADWVAAQSFPSDEKAALLNVAIAGWLKRGNGDEARVWLEERPGDATLDRSRATWAAATIDRDAAASLAMFSSITDPQIRAAKVFEVAAAGSRSLTGQTMDWLYQASRTLPAESANAALSAGLYRLQRVDAAAARGFIERVRVSDPALASRLEARLAPRG